MIITQATHSDPPGAGTPRAILRPPQAAAYVGLKTSTLAKRRVRGERPHFVRLGRKSIGYLIDELDAWLAECRRRSTSDAGTMA